LFILTGGFLPSGARLTRCLPELFARCLGRFSCLLRNPVSYLPYFAGRGIGLLLPFSGGLA
jgi:hypothetical protein